MTIFTYDDSVEFDSTVLHSAYYNREDETLLLVFNTLSQVEYESFSVGDFGYFKGFYSPGRWYNENLRGQGGTTVHYDEIIHRDLLASWEAELLDGVVFTPQNTVKSKPSFYTVEFEQHDEEFETKMFEAVDSSEALRKFFDAAELLLDSSATVTAVKHHFV